MYPIKRGFTLFELLIVLLIISLAYAILIPKNHSKTIRKDIKNLKLYLSKFKGDPKRTLICIDQCKKCYVFMGTKKLKSDFLTEKILNAYEFKSGYLQKMNFSEPFYVDTYEDICFKYSYDVQQKLGDELFLETKKGVYYFSPYFSKVKVFSSVSDAKDYYMKNLEELRD